MYSDGNDYYIISVHVAALELFVTATYWIIVFVHYRKYEQRYAGWPQKKKKQYWKYV